MNFIKRAYKSTKVKMGRTVLLTLVFSAILIFILAGLIIQNASLKAIENASKSTGATVTLSTNIRNAFDRSDNSESDSEEGRPDPGSFQISPVELAIAEELASMDNVASYNYISSTSANAESFDAITSTDESSSENSNSMPGGRMAGMLLGDVTISGTSATDTLSAFTDGTNKLIEGVGLTDEDIDTNNVVIETNLAEANDLSVGDTIEVTSTSDEESTIELTIVGIYESSATVDSRMMQMSTLNPANTIYASYKVANTLKGEDYENTVDSVVYTLEDPGQLQQFVQDAEAAGLDTDAYMLQTNDQMYQQMLQPLENVGDFAEKIVLLVSVAGVVILSLIVILMVRERKHEIGVLLSLGEKRSKVISQFFVEMLIVLIVAIGIAGVSGKYVGNVIGEQLLAQETSTTSEVAAMDGNGPGGAAAFGGRPQGGGGGFQSFRNFGASSSEVATQIKDLDITISLEELVKLGGFGLGIAFISIIIASIGVMRMQPKKILIS
ncbi:FtsX-like permease family protein [Caldibacillus lycopersici]|uniref:FtsX-like permease family protein n=1 Tax=Perspicuibacillus lycopersici TaxID=1325689 RepID=A0AAE3IPU7_9BACI|nr:FtsX-like permease family protein [Perspicuibacillus lycopersici]MCU9612368.1 FtsX-like permease family protein [Perspicuibacillus lycopersici]